MNTKIEKAIEKRKAINFIVENMNEVSIFRAKQMYDKFGTQVFDIIRVGQHRLLEIGIGQETTNDMNRSIEEYEEVGRLSLFLTDHNISKNKANIIYSEFGSLSIKTLKDNPYLLSLKEIITLKEADLIAVKNNIPFNYIGRVEQGIIEVIKENSYNKGNVYTTIKDIEDNISRVLASTNIYKQPGANSEVIGYSVGTALEGLEQKDEIAREINREKEECIYLKHYKVMEDTVVEEINYLNKEKNNISEYNILKEIRHYETTNSINLAKEQKQGIIKALENKISIISGGPGTGKTQTIKAIIEVAKSINKDISIDLMAPTGKAAKRMEEVSGIEAKTIHRALNINKKGLDHNSIISDLVIIDEFSMVDLKLMYYIITLISENTSVVIIGDPDQLPSIGAGSILKDLIASNQIETTTLVEIFRQKEGSHIVNNAYRIVSEDTNLDFYNNENTSNNETYFIESKSYNSVNYILQSINNLMKNKGYSLEDIQVLSFMREGENGVRNLNRKIQETFNGKSGIEVDIDGEKIKRNDRVIHTKNNYDLQVFNGEIGRVLSVSKQNNHVGIVVDYGDRTVQYDNKNFRDLSLAYALSIHKSQGSEFKAVIIPIDKSMEFMISRSTLYTGITRAKEFISFIGEREVLNKGIKNNNNQLRQSMLLEKLIQENKNEEKHEEITKWNFDFDVGKLRKMMEDENINIKEKQKLGKFIIYLMENGNKGEYKLTKGGHAQHIGYSIIFNESNMFDLTGEDYRSENPNEIQLYIKEVIRATTETRAVVQRNKSVINFLPHGNRVYVKRIRKYERINGIWKRIDREDEKEYLENIKNCELLVREEKYEEIEGKNINIEDIDKNMLSENFF